LVIPERENSEERGQISISFAGGEEERGRGPARLFREGKF